MTKDYLRFWVVLYVFIHFNFYTTFSMFSENKINEYSVHNMGNEKSGATDLVTTTANNMPSVISQMSVDQKRCSLRSVLIEVRYRLVIICILYHKFLPKKKNRTPHPLFS